MKFILLPWKPELVFTGTSVMGINPETGKFCSHLVTFTPLTIWKKDIVYDTS
jgi:hypothetical protein